MRARNVSLVVVLTASTGALALKSSAQPAPSAKPALSTSAAAKVEIPPWPKRDGLPAFDAEPFSDEKTKAPKLGEWEPATEVRLTYVSPTISSCRAYRMHEWMKIQCDTKTAGLRLLAGPTDGIALWVADSLVPQKEFEERTWEVAARYFETMGRYGALIFPVRRGDRRVFEWMRLDIWEAYEGLPGVGSTASMMVEEQWLDGAKPEISVFAR